MNAINTYLKALAVGLVAFCFCSGASATVAVPVPTTFYFSGACVDCTAPNNPNSTTVTGSLTLNNYNLGDAIGVGNFVSFTYSGSNLVYPFTVDADNTALYLEGAISNLGVGNEFLVAFTDGFYFNSHSNGAFELCAQGVTGSYTGSNGNQCEGFQYPFNLDFGNTSSWNRTPSNDNNVPEPGSLALMGLGLAAVAAARRKFA